MVVSLLLMRNIANPIDGLCSWQQSKWGFIKYDTYAICLVYIYIFRSKVQRRCG